MWRPKLAVRYGKNGGIASPTTALGVIGYTAFIVCFTTIIALVVTSRKPLGAGGGFALAFAAIFIVQALRDAWAWFASTPAERDEFRQYIANVRLDRVLRRPPASGQTRSDWSNGLVVGLAAVTVGCLALLRVRADFFVPSMFSLAFLVVVLLDRFREAFRARQTRRRPSAG